MTCDDVPSATVEDMFIEVLNGRSDISTIPHPGDDSRVMLGASSVTALARDLTAALAARTDMDHAHGSDRLLH